MRTDPATTKLHLLSWNVFGSPAATDPVAKMKRISRFIESRRFDMVLLQEVWSQEQVGVFESLASYDSYARTADRWWLVPRPGGLMTLVRRDSPWRVRSLAFHEFDAEASDAWLWQGDGIADKGAQRMLVEHPAGIVLTILNTHFQSPYPPRSLFDFADVRERQLQELEDLARVAEGRMPILAVGDLNLGPSTDNYDRLRSFWTDLSQATRERCRCGTHDGEVGGAADWIDYVLARRPESYGMEWDVRRLGRCGGNGDADAATLRLCSSEERRRRLYLSDHHGLEVRIGFRSGAAGDSVDAAVLGALLLPASRRRWLGLAGLAALRALAAPWS